MKQPLLMFVIASAFAAGPAAAQTATQPGQQQPSPGLTSPGAQQPGMQQPGTTGRQATTMQPLATPGPNQMLTSDLRNTTVYGANNENIGNINDVLIDRNGQVVALVVGVGGFLGIGQKDVAIPFQALRIVADQGTAMGTTGTGATTGTGTAAGAQGTINPDRIMLQGMTRADLEAAPEFRPDRTASGRTGATGTTGTGTTGATGGTPQR